MAFQGARARLVKPMLAAASPSSPGALAASLDLDKAMAPDHLKLNVSALNKAIEAA
jgi:hypothetical protein